MNTQGTAAAGRKPPGRRAGVVAGEIVEVDGGHIIRSTGRKDRHSKVCTAKGPRDRRVRLSANTAIQFYDVQDRLGYDRPSKAVDWLITKAKSAIDELEKLPPWNPTASVVAGDPSPATNDGERCNLFPPEMNSYEIPAPETQFPGYFDPRSQDLRLSLQSFQDPIRIQSNRNQAEQEEEDQSPFGYENPHPIISWNLAGAGGYNSGAGGFMFIPPPPQQPPPPPILLGHGVGQAATHFFTQRGTLQSNNTPLVRACIDGEFSHDHHHHHHHNQGVLVQPMPFPGIGFGSPSGGLSSFHIPARIQGDHQEEHDGNKPPSVASTSRH